MVMVGAKPSKSEEIRRIIWGSAAHCIVELYLKGFFVVIPASHCVLNDKNRLFCYFYYQQPRHAVMQRQALFAIRTEIVFTATGRIASHGGQILREHIIRG